MDLSKAQKALAKINHLFESIEIDEGELSSIERDLMLSYIRQLYDFFLDDRVATKPFVASSKKETPPEPTYRKEARKPSPATKPKPVAQPEPVYEEPEKNIELEVSEPEPRSEPQRESPKPRTAKPGSQPGRPTPKPTEEPEYEHLFEQEQIRELADKLSDSPIKDLTTAFSINDRLFNINQLFEGDQDAFVDTLMQLNSMKSFDEAKNFLATQVAEKYNWTAKDKKAVAKNFIKTVRRRFK